MTGRQRDPFDMRELQTAEIMRFNPTHDDPRERRRTHRTDNIAAATIPPVGAVPRALEFEQPPRYSLRESVLFFNNQFADSSNLSNGEFSFDISRLNNQSTLAGVIEIKIAPSFLFPLIAVPDYAPDFHQFGRVFVVFTTVQQCVGAYAARRFHFECVISFPIATLVAPGFQYRNYMILTPISPTFYLDTPITIDKLNVQFLFPVMRGPGVQDPFVAGGGATPVGLVGGVVYTPVQIPQSISGIGFAPVPLPPVMIPVSVSSIDSAGNITISLISTRLLIDVFSTGASSSANIPCSFAFVSCTRILDTSGNDYLESNVPIYGITGRVIVTLSNGTPPSIVVHVNTSATAIPSANVYNMYIYQNRIAFSAGFVSQSVPGESILGGCHC